MDYKIIYETKKKSTSLQKAQKILKKKLKIQTRSQKNHQHSQPYSKPSLSLQKIHSKQKQSPNKLLVRCKSQFQYSSFSKNNFNIGNLEYFNRDMKSKTQHYQRILSLNRKNSASPNIVDFSRFPIQLSTENDDHDLKSGHGELLRTEEGRKQRHTLKTYISTSRICQPNISSKVRLTTLFIQKSPEKESKPMENQKNSDSKIQNAFLRKQLSKKSIFSKMIEKNYSSHLPLIKEKKIHLR